MTHYFLWLYKYFFEGMVIQILPFFCFLFQNHFSIDKSYIFEGKSYIKIALVDQK